jgi:hypothetical protein
MDADGEIDVGPDVIFERVRDRMAVVGVQAAAVPEVAVVYQESGPAGAEVEEPFFGGLEILAGPKADGGQAPRGGGPVREIPSALEECRRRHP